MQHSPSKSIKCACITGVCVRCSLCCLIGLGMALEPVQICSRVGLDVMNIK